MLDDPRFLPPAGPLHVCPRCGKQTMKEVEQNHFHCFWCGFDRRMNSMPEEGCVIPIAIVIGTILLIMLSA